MRTRKNIPPFVKVISNSRANKIRMKIQNFFSNNYLADKITLLSKIALSLQTIKKNNIQNISSDSWKFCEYIRSPILWWFIDLEHSFLISQSFDILEIIDKRHYFSKIFTFKKRTIIEGHLFCESDNTADWKFIINDIIFLKNYSCITWSLDSRLKRIRSHFLESYQKEKGYNLPFRIIEKSYMKLNLKNLKEMVEDCKYSLDFQSYIFKNSIGRITKLNGFVFVSNRYNVLNYKDNIHIWRFIPIFIGKVRKCIEREKKINIQVKIKRNHFHIILQSQTNDLECKNHNLERTVMIRYNADLSYFEILSDSVPHNEVWGLKSTINLLQKMIGVIGVNRLKNYLKLSK